MKRTLNLIALVAICSAMMVSCKNAKQSEPTPEEIEAQKVVLADSVLAQIDALAEQFIVAAENGINLHNIELTEAEKAAKPDYLLEPSFANQSITKTQKVNALAIFNIEYFVRLIYDMPTDEVKESMAKLAVEINHPIDYETIASLDELPSVKISQLYNDCKESGDVAYFWQYASALLREIDYVLAKDTDMFFSHISEEEMNSYNLGWAPYKNAIKTLAPYDEEIALILETIDSLVMSISNEEVNTKYYSTFEQTKESYKNNVFNVIEKRNALLQ